MILNEYDLKTFKHPKENSRFILALFVSILVAIGILVFTVLSFGILLLYLLLLFGVFGLAHAFIKVQLTANAIRVSPYNFPEVYAIAEEVKNTLNYKKVIKIYIVQEGQLNAFLANFFRLRLIILNSGLVEDMIDGEKTYQLKWIIGRFVGALKTKQLRLSLFKFIMESIENMKFFNLFIYPYERATQYTGDNIGLAVCGDFSQSLKAFDKFLVGNKLSKKVSLFGVLEQNTEVEASFLASVSRWFSTHPHLIQRYLNLLAFGKQYFPSQYREYVNTFDVNTKKKLGFLLTNLYPDVKPGKSNNYSINRPVLNNNNNRIAIKRRISSPPSVPSEKSVRTSIRIEKRN